MGSSKVLPMLINVDPRVMAMKGHCTFPRSPELKLHHQMHFSVITRILLLQRGSYSSSEDTVSVFYAQPSEVKKLATLVKGDLKALFSIATTLRCREGFTPSLDWSTLSLILTLLCWVLNKYHFLSLWCDSTWDWTLFSQTIGEHSTH